MQRIVVVMIAAALLVANAASPARAQCTFPHPKKAPKMQFALVPAFVPCGEVGGNSPNAVTESGTPACTPPETRAEQAGSPEGTWTWNHPMSGGYVVVKALASPYCKTAADPAACQTLNPWTQRSDLSVRIVLDMIRYPTHTPTRGTGMLEIVLRATINDTNGAMTTEDYTLEFPFQVVVGDANARTTLDAIFADHGRSGMLPHCANVEVVSVSVFDENGSLFAVPGNYLPFPF